MQFEDNSPEMDKQDGDRLLGEVFKELLETSTLHGLPKIASSRQLIVKMFWLLLFLSTAVILGLQISDLHQQYTSYPVQTSVRLEFSPLTFPAITLCNMNPVRRNKLRHAPTLHSYVKNKTLPEERDEDNSDEKSIPTFTDVAGDDSGELDGFEEIIEEFIDEYGSDAEKSFDDSDDPDTQTPRDYWNDRIHEWKKILVSEGPTIRKMVGHQKNDFIHKITYLGEAINKSQFHQFLSYDYGNCVTVPGNRYRTFRSGVDYGIKITLNLELQQYIWNFTDDYGVRVLFHQPGTYPLPAEDGLTLNPGFETNIGLGAVKVTRLGTPYGECENGVEFEDTYGTRYTTSSCLEWCRLQLMIEACGCLPHDSPTALDAFLNQNLSLCDPGAEARCVEVVTQFFEDETGHCHCEEPCSEIIYTHSLSFRQWPRTGYIKTVLMKELCKKPIQEIWRTACRKIAQGNHDYSRYRRNFIRLNVYFESLKYETIRETPMYKWTRFLSDIGGLLGLFTGASVLSAVELLHLILELCIFCWSRVKPTVVTKGASDGT